MADHVGALPEHLQLKILSMLAPQPTAAAASAPAAGTAAKKTAAEPKPPSDDAAARYGAWAHGLAARLTAHKIAWHDGMLPADAAPSIIAAAQSMPTEALAPAGMSASIARWRDESVRGDKIGWVPLELPATGASQFASMHATAGWAELRAALSQVVDALNHDAAGRPAAERLKLPEKVMLAHYPVGSRYVRHSDVSAALSHRRVTAILYLNADWEPAHGGQLLLYPSSSSPPEQPSSSTVAVAPRLGRLLVFDSHVEHEVCVTHKPRWAVTAWLSVAKAPPVATTAAGPADPMAAILQLAAMATAKPPSAAAPPPPPPPPPPTQPTQMTQTTQTTQKTQPALVPTSAAEGSSAAGSAAASAAATATRPPRIFVSIASYRDPEAPHTLQSLFSQAADASRVVAGVCFQCALDSEEDADCLDLGGLPPECADCH